MAQKIQDDFVSDRQKDNNVTADDLILKMSIARYPNVIMQNLCSALIDCIARLLALLLRQPEVTVEIWERAKGLDRRRVEQHI